MAAGAAPITPLPGSPRAIAVPRSFGGSIPTQTLVLDFRPQPRHVPAIRIAERDAAVRKTMNFFQTEIPAVPKTRYDPAAFRAKVNG